MTNKSSSTSIGGGYRSSEFSIREDFKPFHHFTNSVPSVEDYSSLVRSKIKNGLKYIDQDQLNVSSTLDIPFQHLICHTLGLTSFQDYIQIKFLKKKAQGKSFNVTELKFPSTCFPASQDQSKV